MKWWLEVCCSWRDSVSNTSRAMAEQVMKDFSQGGTNRKDREAGWYSEMLSRREGALRTVPSCGRSSLESCASTTSGLLLLLRALTGRMLPVFPPHYQHSSFVSLKWKLVPNPALLWDRTWLPLHTALAGGGVQLVWKSSWPQEVTCAVGPNTAWLCTG